MYCKLSDDQNVYGTNDGSVIVYSAGKQIHYRFDNGVWVVQSGDVLPAAE
jgi:hypothetical protein